MNEVNIFDLRNTSDLSEEVINLINPNPWRGKLRPLTVKLLTLFVLKDGLFIDEMVVGMYRKYGVVKGRRWVYLTCSNLTRSGILEKRGDGIFQLTESGKKGLSYYKDNV